MGENEQPFTFGFDLPTKTLASITAESNNVCFLVGTSSLHVHGAGSRDQLNRIYKCDFDVDSAALSMYSFRHEEGEVMEISTCSKNENIFSTVYQPLPYDTKSSVLANSEGCIWKMPDSESGEDLYGSELMDMAKIVSFAEPTYENVKSISFGPHDGDDVTVVATSDKMFLYDYSAGQSIFSSNITDKKGAKALTVCSKLLRKNYVALAYDQSLKFFDSNDGKPCVNIQNAHSSTIRNIDLHPYNDMILATSSYTGIQFWDLRNISSPCLNKHIMPHNFWLNGFKWNPLEDSLLLSWSSDTTVCVSYMPSMATKVEDFQRSDDESLSLSSSESDDGSPALRKVERIAEGTLKMWDDHEDSVYAGDWSTFNPHVCATLGWENRLVIYQLSERLLDCVRR